MKQFKAPLESLRDLDAAAAATLIAAAADIAIIVDRTGVIQDAAFGSETLSLEVGGKWLGQRWVATVTVESRAKIEALLREAALRAPPKWRQVNHPSSRGADVPVRYCAVQIDADGHVVAFGSNLQALATLQQRLVDVQQSLEREYWSLRQMESRYRLVFELASEAILIVDASSKKIVEANPAASQLLGEASKGIAGRTFPHGFDAPGTQAVLGLLAAVQALGHGEDARARLANGEQEFLVSAFLLRQENASLFAIRLIALHDEAGVVAPPEVEKVLRIVERAPDGVVVTDDAGRIMTANSAFVNLAQLASERQARGESLERWLGRPGVDLNVLTANLREHAAVRLFATTLRGEYGATAEVEISAVSVRNGEQSYLGFIIRNVSRRMPPDSPTDRRLPQSVEQLTELVGRVPLREIVRQSTDVIERLCVEAALELTGENRASAAELLGLSRQSLYVKLRRYHLRDLVPGQEK